MIFMMLLALPFCLKNRNLPGVTIVCGEPDKGAAMAGGREGCYDIIAGTEDAFTICAGKPNA